MPTVSLPVPDGLTLVGDEWGDPAAPPVLMLHGAGQNRHAWKSTAAVLADHGWYVLTVDARGHGDSDWSKHGHYDAEHTGGDVLALLDRFDRRPVVIGASMGGMAALAAQHLRGGDLFRALVLVDIAPGFAFEGAERIISWMAGNPNGFATLEDASDAMASYNPHRPRPKDLSGLAKVLRHGEDGRWHWRWDPIYITSKPGFAAGDRNLMRAHMDAMNERLLTAARDISAPLLLVRGGRSDLVTEEVARDFQAKVPGSEYVDVADTGHMVAGDDNDAFTNVVLEFLERAR
jgi:pimeloyl-ACP methyl ester carboxylesterase